MKEFIGFLSLTVWLGGFVVAKGFFSTLFCIIPFWAYYLVIEFALLKSGLM